jgi:hypothetical protein
MEKLGGRVASGTRAARGQGRSDAVALERRSKIQGGGPEEHPATSPAHPSGLGAGGGRTAWPQTARESRPAVTRLEKHALSSLRDRPYDAAVGRRRGSRDTVWRSP